MPTEGKSIRMIFMGSDAIALPMLEMIRREAPGGCELIGVFTQPDRRTGRGMRLQVNPVKAWAESHNLPVRQPERVGEEDIEWAEDNEVQFALVMAYGQLLRKAFLHAIPLGVCNLHASLLPDYRGASPIHTALVEGEKETGVSFMKIVPKMDAGPVADQEIVGIGEQSSTVDLYERLGLACIPLTRRCLERLSAGTLSFSEQNPEKVTYCRILRKEDANVDWRQSAVALERRIRGFQPWPGARFLAGEDWIKVGKVSVAGEETEGTPGRILVADQEGFVIACGEGSLRIEFLQRPGGKMLPAADFLRGYSFTVGTQLPLLETEPLVRREFR